MVEQAQIPRIPDDVYQVIVREIFEPTGKKLIALAPDVSRHAAERIALLIQSHIDDINFRWRINNRPAPPGSAHRPRNVPIRRFFGSLNSFWMEFVDWPGVSFNGESYGGPYVRFVQSVCTVLLRSLAADRATRDAPSVAFLEMMRDNPQKVRMWLRQSGLKKFATNFQAFVRGKIFLARGLDGWQFVIDEPRDDCYSITGIDAAGQTRFTENGLNLREVREQAKKRARRLQRTRRTSKK